MYADRQSWSISPVSYEHLYIVVKLIEITGACGLNTLAVFFLSGPTVMCIFNDSYRFYFPLYKYLSCRDTLVYNEVEWLLQNM